MIIIMNFILTIMFIATYPFPRISMIQTVITSNLCIFLYLRRKRSNRKSLMLEPTKLLLPPGELISHPNDPVKMRRLHFQTAGRLPHLSFNKQMCIEIH